MEGPEEAKIDLSGDITVENPVEPTASTSSSSSSGNTSRLLALALSGAAAKEWLMSRRQAVKSWRDFGNTSKFSKPNSISMIGRRVVKNIEHFHGNYMLVFLTLAIFCLLTSPMLLIVLAVVGGACYFVNVKNQQSPLKLMGKEVPLSQQYAGVGLASVPLLWLAGAGGAVFWMLGASFFFIMLHAMFYHQPDALEEAFEIEMNPV